MIKQEVLIDLNSKLDTISMTDFRDQPGELISNVKLGMTYVIEKNGKPIAVLSKLPGVNLTLVIDRNGKKSYKL